MNAEIGAVLQSIGTKPTLAKVLLAASKIDRAGAGEPYVTYSILRNMTLEPGLPAALKVQAARRGFRANVQLGEFGSVQQVALDPTSFLYTQPSDVVVVALHLQTLMPRLVMDYAALSHDEINSLTMTVLETVVAVAEAVRRQSAALLLVHSFELPRSAAFGILDPVLSNGQLNCVRALNLELARRLSTLKSCYVVDVDHLLANHGYEAAIDDRYWHIARAPYTFSFIERLCAEYAKFGAALRGKTKKCLVLDCDNTLWGGVVGEDGINGIVLGETHPGSAYLQFHAAILSLYNRGVLLALNSKNNRADAMQVFESHPSSLLKPHHFVSIRVNWSDKVSNLREIAAELNIGLDSLVFMDDNPFECELVRTSVPEVTVIELPADASRYAEMLNSGGLFDTLALSDEDRRRSEMYRSESRRTELKASTGSMPEYLASLDMRLSISKATSFSVPRIAQLTQKTNQFNLTTRRYTEGDIERLMTHADWHVYFAQLEDKFDKAGIIAVALVFDSDGASRIDTFLMSCRVIGRGVEHAFLAAIAQDSFERGNVRLVGEYVPTAKNELVRELLPSVGFRPDPTSDGRYWELVLAQSMPAAPGWFSEIRAPLATVS